LVVIVGVDSSTQSCKVELRDQKDGRLLGSGWAPHPPAFGPRSEQDPRVWWEALRLALGHALQAGDVERADVAGMSVAGQSHGLVALDVHNEPIRPAKLWNDTTSSGQLDRLRERIGAQRWIRAVGSLPTAAFTASKIIWLRENEPENYRRMVRLCLPHDWLTLKLTGALVTDRSEASGTGYFSAAQGCYLPEILELVDPDFGWEGALPKVLGPLEAAGTLTAEAATFLGLPQSVVVGPGGGDQEAAALGLGVRPGDVVYTFGTSGVVYTVSRDPVFDLTGAVDGVADMNDGYLPLVSTLNAARVTDLMARLLAVDSAELSDLALAAGSGQGPVLAAFLDGERTPNLPLASGLLAGLTSSTTRADLARSAFEGVVLGLVTGEDQLNAAGVSTSGRTLITGGGAQSAAYRQLLADLTGRPVSAVDASEATARGACLQAAAVSSGADLPSVAAAWELNTSVVAEPRPGSEADLPAIRERYRTVAGWRGYDGLGPVGAA
jgi:xylulokinase